MTSIVTACVCMWQDLCASMRDSYKSVYTVEFPYSNCMRKLSLPRDLYVHVSLCFSCPACTNIHQIIIKQKENYRVKGYACTAKTKLSLANNSVTVYSCDYPSHANSKNVVNLLLGRVYVLSFHYLILGVMLTKYFELACIWERYSARLSFPW